MLIYKEDKAIESYLLTISDFFVSRAKFRFEALKSSREFLNKNKTALIEKGFCRYAEGNSIMAPFAMYPTTTEENKNVDFLSANEMAKIDRELLFELKMDVLNLLEEVKEKSWIDNLADRLSTFRAETKNWRYYVDLDRIYQVQAYLKSLDRAYEVGGLTSILESAYSVYEIFHAPRFRELFDILGQNGVDVNDSDGVISFIKENSRATVTSTYKVIYADKEFRNYFLRLRLHRAEDPVVKDTIAFSKFTNHVDLAFGAKRKGHLAIEKIFKTRHQLIQDFIAKPFDASPEYSTVIFGGEEFNLTDKQAKIVKLLHDAQKSSGSGYLSQKEIGHHFYPDDSKKVETFRVEDKFKIPGIKRRLYRDAFHRLIEMNKDDGSKGNRYRLRMPETFQIKKHTA